MIDDVCIQELNYLIGIAMSRLDELKDTTCATSRTCNEHTLAVKSCIEKMAALINERAGSRFSFEGDEWERTDITKSIEFGYWGNYIVPDCTAGMASDPAQFNVEPVTILINGQPFGIDESIWVGDFYCGANKVDARRPGNSVCRIGNIMTANVHNKSSFARRLDLTVVCRILRKVSGEE